VRAVPPSFVVCVVVVAVVIIIIEAVGGGGDLIDTVLTDDCDDLRRNITDLLVRLETAVPATKTVRLRRGAAAEAAAAALELGAFLLPSALGSAAARLPPCVTFGPGGLAVGSSRPRPGPRMSLAPVTGTVESLDRLSGDGPLAGNCRGVADPVTCSSAGELAKALAMVGAASGSTVAGAVEGSVADAVRHSSPG
jgi:hypothetical protein